MRSRLGTKSRLAAHLTSLALLLLMLVYMTTPVKPAIPASVAPAQPVQPVPQVLEASAPIITPDAPSISPAVPSGAVGIEQEKPVEPRIRPTTPPPLPPQPGQLRPPEAPAAPEEPVVEPAIPEAQPAEPVQEEIPPVTAPEVLPGVTTESDEQDEAVVEQIIGTALDTLPSPDSADIMADLIVAKTPAEPILLDPEGIPPPDEEVIAWQTETAEENDAPPTLEELNAPAVEPAETPAAPEQPAPAVQPDESGSLVVADSDADGTGTAPAATPLPATANLEVLDDGVYWLDSNHDIAKELAAIPETGTLILLAPLPGYRVQGLSHIRTDVIPADTADLTKDAAQQFIHQTQNSAKPVVVAAIPGARGAAFFKGVYLLVQRHMPFDEMVSAIEPDFAGSGAARDELLHRLRRIDAGGLKDL